MNPHRVCVKGSMGICLDGNTNSTCIFVGYGPFPVWVLEWAY